MDAEGVLGRDGCDGGGAVDTKGDEGAQVSLNAGAATGVGASDGEHGHWLHRSTLVTPLATLAG